MAIGDIVKRIGDDFATWWGDRLRGWMAAWVEGGAIRLFDFFEPDIRAEVKPSLLMLRDIEGLPDDIKSIVDKALAEPKAIHLVVLLPYLVALIMGTAMGAARPIANWMSYPLENAVHSYRLDPYSIITAWRRDPAKYKGLFDDLKDQGWDDDRIEALKFYSEAFPTLQDVIRFYAREAFEPDMIKRYGLLDELPPYEGTLFEKLGVPKEIADLYWIAHWEHASWMQVVEMLRRGQLTEDEVREWFRVVEIPPYWRDKLIAISYEVPTRVDVRRFWDMGTIDEARLREIYAWRGYHGKDLDDYVLWTKIYVAFPDLVARYKNGWINKETVLSEVIALGMPPQRAQLLFETKFKKVGAERTATERDLTATDIIAGVKKGIITWAEGIELLMDLGYDEDEADFKLAVRIETAGGSPANMAEYKRLTQLYRVSQGLPTKMTVAEIKAAEKELAEKYPKRVPLTEEELKLKVDTIRRKRRARQLTRDQEIADLLKLDLTVELATAYADNDDLRLRPVKESK